MKDFFKGLAWFLVVLAIAGAIVGAFIADYLAYKQRFPWASWWTYFFK